MNHSTFSISASTKVFAVLGHPVSHSLSPAMHNPTLQAMGLNAVYLAFDTEPDHLMQTLAVFAQRGFSGVNLTIPLKEIAFQGIKRLSASAELSGSVNTVVFHADGSLEGHSTDGYGLSESLKESFKKDFADQKVLVLGCGGAGRAAALQAAADGAAKIILSNRTLSRATALGNELQKRFPEVHLQVEEVWPPRAATVQQSDLILQSTSLGMKEGDESWLGTSHFRPGQCLLDMTYVQLQTPVMAAASAAGAEVANGLSMLLHQGVRSLEIWTGKKVPVEIMRAALRHQVYGENP